MKITRINHAAVNVYGKVDEAREFYTGLLGLPEIAIQLPGRPPLPKGSVPAFWLELGVTSRHVGHRELRIRL
jgi:catechol 2,3-dioxygenase-like lactoylglutathione lyase family enzyme